MIYFIIYNFIQKRARNIEITGKLSSQISPEAIWEKCKLYKIKAEFLSGIRFIFCIENNAAIVLIIKAINYHWSDG